MYVYEVDRYSYFEFASTFCKMLDILQSDVVAYDDYIAPVPSTDKYVQLPAQSQQSGQAVYRHIRYNTTTSHSGGGGGGATRPDISIILL